MSPPPLTIGLVGCGRIARRVHADVLRSLPGARVTAVADPDESARREVGARVGASAAFASPEELLARDEIEAVVVCVPNHLHAAVAVAAFEAGKHVYLEKPIAHDLVAARRVLEAWRASGRVGMVGFNYRFHPGYQAARAALGDGAIGDLRMVRSVFTTPGRSLPEWKRRRASGGGALLDYGSHHVDLARFVTGREVASAAATLRSVQDEHDMATLELELEGGVPVLSAFSSCAAEQDRFELHGTEGTLVIDRLRARAPVLETAPGSGSRARRLAAALRAAWPVVRSALGRGGEVSFGRALAAFVAAARTGAPVSPDLGDGERSLAVLVAAERSAGGEHTAVTAPPA